MADADGARAHQPPQLQFDGSCEGERPLRSDEQMSKINGLVPAGPRGKRIDIVAADAALDFGEAGCDLVRLASAESDKIIE